jgi:hypothetical protein
MNRAHAVARSCNLVITGTVPPVRRPRRIRPDAAARPSTRTDAQQSRRIEAEFAASRVGAPVAAPTSRDLSSANRRVAQAPHPAAHCRGGTGAPGVASEAPERPKDSESVQNPERSRDMERRLAQHLSQNTVRPYGPTIAGAAANLNQRREPAITRVRSARRRGREPPRRSPGAPCRGLTRTLSRDPAQWRRPGAGTRR